MRTVLTPRLLTIDEKKAAEAAFRGEPLDPRWSDEACAIYEGIRKAMGPRAALVADKRSEQPVTSSESEPPGQTDQVPEASNPPVMTREEAIQAGYLIDVTPIAQSMGLPVPVCFSKALWNFVVTASHTLPEEQHASRIKDVLTGLRLRLAMSRVASPAIEFAALLTFPPEPAPQLCPLYAIAMGDDTVPFSFTILLANEVSAIIRPTGN
jgi:hypothetical protein